MKILIVDDHPVFRKGFAALLQHSAEGMIVLEAGSVDDAHALLNAHTDLDVVVVDLMMPGKDGRVAIADFAHKRQDLPIIVLSSSEDPKDARQTLAMGALGYVPKSASPHAILSAIKLVMNGEVYVPPLVLSDPRPRTLPLARIEASMIEALTDRQIEVLKLLVLGLPNKTIARKLELSEKTVKTHITAIFKALNVVNRTQAAAAGRDVGLL